MFSIFTLETEDITDITDWAGSIVGDLMPLLIVIIGITIGLFIIKAILHLRD